MTDYILSIDCGVSTGIALIGYSDNEPPTLECAWQFSGGVVGLLAWCNRHYAEAYYDLEWGEEYAPAIRPSGPTGPYLYLEDETDTRYTGDSDEVEVIRNRKNVTIIAEKFTARNTRGFSYTTAALEPLRCEGVLIAKGLMPDYDPKEKRWRDPGLQYLVGGKDLAAKRSRQHAFLEDSGFYRTNKDFPDSPSKDKADDFRSAASHGIAYLAREVGNKPAYDLISTWVERNPV